MCVPVNLRFSRRWWTSSSLAATSPSCALPFTAALILCRDMSAPSRPVDGDLQCARSQHPRHLLLVVHVAAPVGVGRRLLRRDAPCFVEERRVRFSAAVVLLLSRRAGGNPAAAAVRPPHAIDGSRRRQRLQYVSACESRP